MSRSGGRPGGQQHNSSSLSSFVQNTVQGANCGSSTGMGEREPSQHLATSAGGPEEPVQPQVSSAGGPEEPVQPQVSSAGGSREPSQLPALLAGGPEEPIQHHASSAGGPGGPSQHILMSADGSGSSVQPPPAPPPTTSTPSLAASPPAPSTPAASLPGPAAATLPSGPTAATLPPGPASVSSSTPGPASVSSSTPGPASVSSSTPGPAASASTSSCPAVATPSSDPARPVPPRLCRPLSRPLVGRYGHRGRPPERAHPRRWLRGPSWTPSARPDKPKPTLSTDNTTVPVGGTVTLTCSVTQSSSSSSSGWKYFWYRDNILLNVVSSSDGQLSVSQEGLYRCKGRRGNPAYYTEASQEVQIYITASAVVTVQPDWPTVYSGEMITLSCEIQGGDTEWQYEWRTTSSHKPSNQSELRVDSASLYNDGHYECRGRRKSAQNHLTEWSVPLNLTVSHNVHSAASLTVSPDRVQHFTSDSVSLTCEGNFTEWRVSKFSEKGFFSHCCDCQKLSGSSYKIHSLQEGVTVYWCESGSGELSNAVNITVRGSGSKIGSFIVPFIIGLVSGIILVLLLLCCCRKIKIFFACFSLTQSQSTNQNSAAQQKVNKNENNVYSSLLPGDFPVYEIMRSSGNTGSGAPADEYTNVTSTLELKVIDEKTDFRKWRNDDPDGSSDYDDVNLETGSVSGSGRGRGH
ncbi:unnamed protein product [Oreochromis niloticus]|nr:unnamed protein product [Mustela putorius furo]